MSAAPGPRGDVLDRGRGARGHDARGVRRRSAGHTGPGATDATFALRRARRRRLRTARGAASPRRGRRCCSAPGCRSRTTFVNLAGRREGVADVLARQVDAAVRLRPDLVTITVLDDAELGTDPALVAADLDAVVGRLRGATSTACSSGRSRPTAAPRRPSRPSTQWWRAPLRPRAGRRSSTSAAPRGRSGRTRSRRSPRRSPPRSGAPRPAERRGPGAAGALLS